MCTLSWLGDTAGYQIFFNRDEQRSRPSAIPPQISNQEGHNVLMPVDPEGGGSWISVNEHRVSLCLLNYYQGVTPPGSLISRGQLLRSLSHHADFGAISKQLATLTLSHYAPFTLIVFSPSEESDTDAFVVNGCQWDGETLNHFKPVSPTTSSSVKLDEVTQARQQSYMKNVRHSSLIELTQFHAGHGLHKGYQSVCMHREDAKTVSFSHIRVNHGKVSFSYKDGSPCDTQAQTHVSVMEISNYG